MRLGDKIERSKHGLIRDKMPGRGTESNQHLVDGGTINPDDKDWGKGSETRVLGKIINYYHYDVKNDPFILINFKFLYRVRKITYNSSQYFTLFHISNRKRH